MIYDSEKNKIVKQLGKLRNLKDKSEYLSLRKSIMKKYKVSLRTVQRWQIKKTPGRRKGRNDSGKVRKKIKPSIKRVVREFLESGMEIKEIRKFVTERYEKISNQMMSRIREQIQKSKVKSQKKKAGQDKQDGQELPPNHKMFGCHIEPLEDEELEETNWGDAAKEMFEKLFEMDLISPDRGVGVKVNGKKFIVPKDDLNDICLILANAYNRKNSDKLKLDRRQLLRQRIFHLIEQQVRLATIDRADTKTIESLTRMYDRMIEQTKVEADIRTVEQVCKDLKPDITFDEIISLIQKHTDPENG